MHVLHARETLDSLTCAPARFRDSLRFDSSAEADAVQRTSPGCLLHGVDRPSHPTRCMHPHRGCVREAPSERACALFTTCTNGDRIQLTTDPDHPDFHAALSTEVPGVELLVKHGLPGRACTAARRPCWLQPEPTRVSSHPPPAPGRYREEKMISVFVNLFAAVSYVRPPLWYLGRSAPPLTRPSTPSSPSAHSTHKAHAREPRRRTLKAEGWRPAAWATVATAGGNARTVG